MDKEISEYIEPDRFKSRHIVHTRTGDREVFNCTGIVLTDIHGRMEGTLKLVLRFDDILPDGKALQVEQFAPFIAINGISLNTKQVDASEYGKAWKVEEFDGPGSVLISHSYTLTAKVFVSPEEDLTRVAYNVIFKGLLVDHKQPTPK